MRVTDVQILLLFLLLFSKLKTNQKDIDGPQYLLLHANRSSCLVCTRFKFLENGVEKIKHFEYRKTGSNSEIGSLFQNVLAKKNQNNNIESHRLTIRAQSHFLRFAQANFTLKEKSGLEIHLFEVIKTSNSSVRKERNLYMWNSNGTLHILA